MLKVRVCLQVKFRNVYRHTEERINKQVSKMAAPSAKSSRWEISFDSV